MDWGITYLDELQKMKKEMDHAWADVLKEDPGREKEVGEWIERLPKFEGPGRNCSRSRSKRRIRPF